MVRGMMNRDKFRAHVPELLSPVVERADRIS
jgi:hypothetical protein